MPSRNRQQGFSAIYVSVLVVFLTLSIGANIFLLASTSQKTVVNERLSLQSLYAAESGVEDALLRLKKGISWTNPLSVLVGNAQAQTTISNLVGGARTVLATGNLASRTRRVQAVYAIDSSVPSFFYGAQVGTGGVVMDNLSKITGNVFSNGNIQGSSGTTITGTAIVAGQANTITNASITQDAYVQSCVNSSVGGILHAAAQSGCTFASLTASGIPVSSAPLPISQAEIDEWKQDALAGGVISGNYELSGTESATLGPKKIQGSLTVQNFAQLTLAGTLWVTGSIEVKNSAQVRLGTSYGTLSGVIVSDGNITLQNNSISSGSGQQGSYLMYLSTSPSEEAIRVKNNTIADILYTSQGGIDIENNIQTREVTGHSLHIQNNSTITYETGLQNAAFVSGPGAGWNVKSWKEVE
ncbi:MAG: Uncharacterized protein Greene101447_134 [Parcubacteria group bacterium Greene1014_47]|nr:MAG: Uncharacterized protein Greene101447_134 [Parcubacteria group bacterium Greene1014_47]